MRKRKVGDYCEELAADYHAHFTDEALCEQVADRSGFNLATVYGLLPDVERGVANRVSTGSGAVVYPACLWRR
jgi:hypothetical protein